MRSDLKTGHLTSEALTHQDLVCSEDEIKQELNARGYDDVLGMDVDIALEALFTEISTEMHEQVKRVRLCSQSPESTQILPCLCCRQLLLCTLSTWFESNILGDIVWERAMVGIAITKETSGLH